MNLRPFCLALGLSAALLGTGCVSKPSMELHHAQVSGVTIPGLLPPRVSIQMTVYLSVYNPNRYDVAVRAVRGQTLIGDRYTVPVYFTAPGSGAWLPAKQKTLMAVPVELPLEVCVGVLGQSFFNAQIPYRFQGKADVTATSSLQLEKDDYSVNEAGSIPRDQIAQAMRSIGR